MLYYTGLIFLVIAVSLDGFGVGITYGLRKIRVPFLALLIITLCSGVVVLLSMTIGSVLQHILPKIVTTSLGSILLISLGLFSLINTYRQKKHRSDDIEKLEHHWKDVLTNPEVADLDRSGTINFNEAIILGFALAIDAFGSGIGASVIGYPPLLTTLLIAMMSGLFVFSGLKVGLYLSKNERLTKYGFFPPLLLILIGLINLIR